MTENEKLSGAELINPYASTEEGGERKTTQVERMFDSIAPSYDFMNLAMTMGLCTLWRNRALDLIERVLLRAGRPTPSSVLDVATGTGDVAFEMARRWPAARITGLDLSAEMLRMAERKQEEAPALIRSRITFLQGDCLQLPFADDSFDLITVAYGVRNFEHLSKGYSEMWRVLRPKGILCVIELSRPVGKITAPLYDFYANSLIPLAGRIVSGDPRAYSYLPESIAAAPQRADMCRIMKEAGFNGCVWKSLTFGAVTIYLACKTRTINSSDLTETTISK